MSKLILPPNFSLSYIANACQNKTLKTILLKINHLHRIILLKYFQYFKIIETRTCCF